MQCACVPTAGAESICSGETTGPTGQTAEKLSRVQTKSDEKLNKWRLRFFLEVRALRYSAMLWRLAPVAGHDVLGSSVDGAALWAVI